MSREEHPRGIAIVTGASQGIGRAIALALADAGFVVHAVARDATRLKELATSYDSSQTNSVIVPRPLDLSNDDSLDAAIDDWCRDPQPISVLVHCAGAISHAETREASLDDLDFQLAVNFRAAYKLTQALLPKLIECQGDIAFINSSVTQNPRANSGQFAATAHALIGFADSLREELNSQGVRVLSIYPGKTATQRQERLHGVSGASYLPDRLLQPEEIATMLVAAISLPATAEVTEIRIRPRLK